MKNKIVKGLVGLVLATSMATAYAGEGDRVVNRVIVDITIPFGAQGVNPDMIKWELHMNEIK